MSNTRKEIQETYVINADGTTKEVIVKEIEVEIPSVEVEIALKEAELLAMYKELEALKQK
tara:strand:- start:539 stop:718 length:180 start_codon:yes stop_codon:yes gene_type:complete